MNKFTLTTSVAGAALLLASVAPGLALAEDNISVGGSASTSVTVTAPSQQEQEGRHGGRFNLPKFNLMGSTTARFEKDKEHKGNDQEHMGSTTDKRIEKGQEKGNNEIDKRIKSLQELSARLANIKLLSATTLATIQASINTEIQTLTALKAKIATDTATTTLKSDVEDITKANRVFLLVEPQARIAASSSRINAVVAQMQQLSTKLQTRITAVATAGTDVTAATAALTDLNVKIADAKVQADAAVTLTANLKADNGDKTVLAANKAALKAAQAKLSAAQKDLAAARHDVESILKGIKITGNAEASTSENH